MITNSSEVNQGEEGVAQKTNGGQQDFLKGFSCFPIFRNSTQIDSGLVYLHSPNYNNLL